MKPEWRHRFPERPRQRAEAIAFVKELWAANIHRIAIENPMGVLHDELGKPAQIIQPYDHGHGEQKRTCLWLKNLPLLQPSEINFGREQKVFLMRYSKTRSMDRSRTYPGIARAMAAQWGKL
jgi:hypothetical protein